MIAATVYVLAAVTALLCAVLLFQGWRRTRLPLLFWSGLCFAGLTLSNIVLAVDLLIVPSVDLAVWRNGTALLALVVLLYGLIWKLDQR
jgi:hypothetical protein